MGHAHHQPKFCSRQAVLATLEKNMGRDLLLRDVALRAGVSEMTANRRLHELREEGLAFSRRAVTLDRCPLLWGRVAV